jgi:hypothetical protein
METKICKDCLIEYPLDQLKQNKRYEDGYEPRCKKCNTIRTKKYRANNINKVRAKGRERAKKYREDPQYIAYVAQWRIDNKEQIKAYNQTPKAKKRIREYNKEKYHTDPINKLKHTINSRFNKAIKIGGYKKKSRLNEIIGCSWEQLNSHLEKQFDKKMNWDNHGTYWETDHIIPLASAKNEDEIYKLSHYTNLQPLYWKDNREKSDKII